MIRIEYTDREVLDYLSELSGRLSDMTPVMADIGELLTETTKRRFDTSSGPDGERWAPNTQTTILNYLGVHKGSYTKDGRLSSKGAQRVMGKKPLIGETRSLINTIHYQLVGSSSVEIGSPIEYSAVQQFGAKQGVFGASWQTHSNKSSRHNQPIPWGDIPARPFLGISGDDERAIMDIVTIYLQS